MMCSRFQKSVSEKSQDWGMLCIFFYRKVIYKYTRKSEMGALPPPETSDDDTKLQGKDNETSSMPGKSAVI
jgi:hypothetical protein